MARTQIVLVLEILLAAVLGRAIYQVRRRPRPQVLSHCRAMTFALAGQSLLSLFTMVPRFVGLLPGLRAALGVPAILGAVLHGLLGLASLSLGWWVVLALRLKLKWPLAPTPRAFRWPMRATALTWVVALTLGLAVYGLWYL